MGIKDKNRDLCCLLKNLQRDGRADMKIAIAGAGAMGSRFGIMLHQAGEDVVLIDNWVEHVQQMSQSGIRGTLNGKEIEEKIPVYLPKDIPAGFSVDLIIVFTKALDLEQMLQDIQSIIDKKTDLLCLLNGIGHEDVMKKYVSPEHLLIGNTMWTANLKGPGQVELFGDGSVALQNLEAGQEETAQKVAGILSAAGLNAVYSKDILFSIYKKACVNGTMNCLCTLLDVSMADFGETSEAKRIVTEIVTEFAQVAAVEGVELNVSEMVDYIAQCYDRQTIGNHYPSMHQDLIKNHRRTEIDFINGAIVRKGQKYGIATPYCQLLVQLIHCKEEILQAN